MALSNEEHIAKAMLLGLEPVLGSTMCPDGVFRQLLRHRDGPNMFGGMANFSYTCAETLEPVKGLQGRSEVDQPLKRRKWPNGHDQT